MTKRQFWERAYLRACSLASSGFLSSALASRMINGKPLASRRRKSMNPLVVFSKLSPSASRSVDLIVTLGSRRMLAGALPSGKKRQSPASSSLLILIRAVASFSGILIGRPHEVEDFLGVHSSLLYTLTMPRFALLSGACSGHYRIPGMNEGFRMDVIAPIREYLRNKPR